MSEVDYGLLAQQAAQDHLDACEEWFWHYEGEGPRPTGEDPASAPYCSCHTCMVREVLFAAWPILLQAARDEVRQEQA